MAPFTDWFRQREGQDPLACPWLQTFILSEEATEVEQVFLHHQDTLLAAEMVEELEGMRSIMHQRLPQPAAVHVLVLAQDRLRLIEDAQRYGVAEAIRLHQPGGDQTQASLGSALLTSSSHPEGWFSRKRTIFWLLLAAGVLGLLFNLMGLALPLAPPARQAPCSFPC